MYKRNPRPHACTPKPHPCAPAPQSSPRPVPPSLNDPVHPVSPLHSSPSRPHASPTLTRVCVAVLPLCAGLFSAGCRAPGPGRVDLDFSGETPRFIIDHRGWPAPFLWPAVEEFVLASEADDRVLWRLEASGETGPPARRLILTYGETPAGLRQTIPPGAAPPPLSHRGNYYVAAQAEYGAGDDRKEVYYRMVFRLPAGGPTAAAKPSAEAAKR